MWLLAAFAAWAWSVVACGEVEVACFGDDDDSQHASSTMSFLLSGVHNICLCSDQQAVSVLAQFITD